MSNDKAMLELRARFNADAGFIHRWQAIGMAREWANLTGDFKTNDALTRFMEFMEGGRDAA